MMRRIDLIFKNTLFSFNKMTVDQEISQITELFNDSLSLPKNPIVQSLRAKLLNLGLPTLGTRQTLTKRLKKHYSTQSTVPKNIAAAPTIAYYCVIDFEATCIENAGFDYENEIIEFPAILIHAKSLTIVLFYFII